MTEQVIKISIETIKHMTFCGYCTTGPCNECNRYIAKNTAIEALEKQIPKKVNEVYCCPICNTYGKDDEGVEGDYCPNCGQRLDWSVSE